MIAQEIVFTWDFLKASRIRDYAQLKKIPCGNKKQARARVIYEFSGLEIHWTQFASSRINQSFLNVPLMFQLLK